jgi:hypothetical protein
MAFRHVGTDNEKRPGFLDIAHEPAGSSVPNVVTYPPTADAMQSRGLPSTMLEPNPPFQSLLNV